MPSANEAFIAASIGYWQRVLNILHWRIDFRMTDSGRIPNSLMEIRPTRVRHHARIFIKPKCLLLSSNAVEKLIVHELVHLIYDPLVEEHSIQLSYDNDQDRRVENKDRFTRTLEKCVEHTAQMITDMLLAENIESDDDIATLIFSPNDLTVLYCCVKTAEYLAYPSVFNVMGMLMPQIDQSISIDTAEAKLRIFNQGRKYLEFNTEHIRSDGEIVPVHVVTSLGPNHTLEMPQLMEEITLLSDRHQGHRKAR